MVHPAMPSDDLPSDLVGLTGARERAVARLSDAFAADTLDVEEFERRLTLAHRANTISELDQTLADLGAADPPATRAIAVRQPAANISVSEGSGTAVVAIFGGVERRGSWTLPRQLSAFAVMGGIVLDFREAVLMPGVTEIHVVAVMGGVELIVPPTLSVEVSGAAIFGGFGHVERVPAESDPSRPVLRVRGVAAFGGVSVETRLPGESERDAHRRRRHGPALEGGRTPRQLPAKPTR